MNKPDSLPLVTIYTDGACTGNPGPGGWAAVLKSGKSRREISGGEPDTTNNRMELTAAIKALEALKHPSRVALYSDSAYLVKGMTEWLPGWKARGWKRKTGKIENLKLWQRLDALAALHKVEWRWVRGHFGDPENERADRLAVDAIPK